MTPTPGDARALQPGDADAPGPRASHATPPDIVAQRLVAVPWRHAGLIAACVLAGGLASSTFWRHAAPVRVVAAKPHVQAIQDAPFAAAAGLELRLDFDPGAPQAAMQTADAAQASATPLRLDDVSESDGIEAALRQAPPAAGRLMGTSTSLAPAPAAERPRPTLPGLAAGLLLGLLLAALRELGGERMRSAREASWALGAPVLGAIPTLSAKAREMLLESRPAAPDAA